MGWTTSSEETWEATYMKVGQRERERERERGREVHGCMSVVPACACVGRQSW